MDMVVYLVYLAGFLGCFVHGSIKPSFDDYGSVLTVEKMLTLVDKITLMEKKIENLEKLERAMLQEITVMRDRIEKFETSEKLLRTSASDMYEMNRTFRIQIDELITRLQICEKNKDKICANSTGNHQNHFNSDMDSSILKHVSHDAVQHEKSDPFSVSKSARGIRQSPYGVAFTAYLDHVVKSIGTDQTIIYNHVLLNDHDGYSNNTGIFRAPVSGLYLFSWSVRARADPDTYDVLVPLLVNGVHQLGAIAESPVAHDDNQGSNSAVVRLLVGDEVWTVHEGLKTEVFGSNQATTSFMGVLLYEYE